MILPPCTFIKTCTFIWNTRVVIALFSTFFYFQGGLEAFEEKLRLEEEEKEAAKQQEVERRQEISKKTRSRLSELLDRKRAEVLLENER